MLRKDNFEIKSELESVFSNYVTDAAITVRLVNNYVSILGEVNALKVSAYKRQGKCF